ncbi:hypothetical protein HDU76_004030 [Blyttiomyces sp. JEL0837]|nr:hypothetical protein HDU76_004030 [Blyttiomyces sp. JEL0837]
MHFLTIIAPLMLIAQASAQSFNHCEGTAFCAYFNFNVPSDTVTITVSTDKSGWVGLGIGGTEMVGPSIYVGWLGSDGKTPIVSQRIATQHRLPSVVTTTDYNLLSTIPSDVSSSLKSSKIAFSFTRSIKGGNVANVFQSKGATSFMYAYSNSAPGSPNSNTSSFVQHDVTGDFTLDLTSVGGSSGTNVATTTTAAPGKSGALEVLSGSRVLAVLAGLLVGFVALF